MRPRKVTDVQLERLKQVAEARSRTPSNKELAFELGVSLRTVESYITLFMRDPAVSHGAASAKIAS